MTLNDFVSKYNGKGVDFDGAYGFQCKDLANQYAREVCGKDLPRGNAIDMARPVDGYDWIINTATAVPAAGDIVVWGAVISQYGHIAIFLHGDATSFTSLDQNWPVGSLTHQQHHDYHGVLGWLRRHVDNPTPPADSGSTVTPLEEFKNSFITVFGAWPTPDQEADFNANHGGDQGYTYFQKKYMPEYNDSLTKPLTTEITSLQGQVGTLAADLQACEAKPPVVVTSDPVVVNPPVVTPPVSSPHKSLWEELRAIFHLK